MARPGDVLEAPRLGVRIEFRRTTEETGGELVEFDLVGRPRGFITQPHVHPHQRERHEVIEGSLRIVSQGFERILSKGDVHETRADTKHRHDGAGRVRVQIRPAGRFEAWLERLVAMDRDGEMLAGGWPRPRAGARLLLDFDGEAHGTVAPLAIQRRLARAIVAADEKAAQRRR